MKILHTADWHIGQFKGPVVDGVNLRSQDTVKCLEYMVQVAIEEKPDIVCVSGDIFHQEQVGPVRYSDEMITATNIITSLAHFSKYVIVMRGTPNHDGAAQFRVLERMLLNIRNVDVVTEPGVIKTPWADIACLPGFDKQEFRAKFPGLSADEENLAWTKYISDMVFALRAECEKTPILMAHYTVPGCNMESGQTSFFTNFEPVIPREALMAARYEAVLLGHIHRPQIIEGLDNVFYSGAINAMNFNDEGQDRGFWIHEFNEKGTLVKGHKCTTPYRQFHTITWDPDEAGDYIREGAMYLHRTGISEDVTDKIVRVRYSCTSEQKKALNIPLLQKNLYVKSLPVELDNLKKCEEEIEILTSERDKKIADKQEEIGRIGYDPKRLAILTAYERLEGKVLVVIVDHKDKAKNIYGTVTHNRARGTHLLEPMKKIVKELMDEGKTVEEIGKQLGMRPEEIFRLSDFSKEDFLKMMTKGVTGYSKAEFITKI